MLFFTLNRSQKIKHFIQSYLTTTTTTITTTTTTTTTTGNSHNKKTQNGQTNKFVA